jgi:hypothetical protein
MSAMHRTNKHDIVSIHARLGVDCTNIAQLGSGLHPTHFRKAMNGIRLSAMRISDTRLLSRRYLQSRDAASARCGLLARRDDGLSWHLVRTDALHKIPSYCSHSTSNDPFGFSGWGRHGRDQSIQTTVAVGRQNPDLT